jgi:hypothetical protein
MKIALILFYFIFVETCAIRNMRITLLRATEGTDKHNEGPHSWRGLKCGDKTKQTNTNLNI